MNERSATNEQSLKQIVDSIPAMAWSADTDGNVDFFNRHFVDYVGAPLEQLKDGGWKTAVHPDDVERLLSTWKSVMATDQGGEAEARLRRFDGKYRWFLMRVNPLLDDAGKVVKWYGANTDIDDWRQTQQALHTQDFLLKGVAESIAAPLVFLTPDGSIEVINQRLLDFFGKTREQMQGWQSNEVIHPEDRAATVDALRVAIETGQPYEVEARRRRADGVYRWWRSNGYPMRDREGRIIRWCVLYTDVHDRKLAEEALHASELMLDSMVDSIAAPLGFFKPTGELEVVNRMVLDYFGKPFDALAKWDNIVHPDDLEGSRAAWTRSLETGQPYVFEARIRHHDGTYRWNDHRGYPMRDADGKIVRWCVLQLDVHDRKQVEKAIRASEAALTASERKLQIIIDAIPALVWSALSDGSADFVNQHYLDYVGMTMEEVRTWGWTKAVHPDDLPDFIARWQKILESGRAGENQARLRRADGEYRWFLFRGSPVVDDAGQAKWFGINIDIEERVRAEEAVRESEINLRQQTETIPQMLWSARPDGAFDYCNARFLDYTGSAARGVMGDGWRNAIHPDDREHTARAWKHSVATGEPYSVEVRKFCAAAGEYHWCLTTALPLRDERGRIIKWHGASIDIHDRKMTELNLRRMTETFPQMLWSATPEGAIDYCNERLLEYSGLTAASVMDSGWANLLHPDDREPTAKIWLDCVATGSPYKVEVRHFNVAEQSYRWILTSALPLRNAEGRIIKWYGACVDIHDQKLAEQALAASERKLKLIINTIPAMAWSANPDGMCDFFNQNHLDYVGLPMEEMCGIGFVKTFHPDDLPQLMGPWQEMMATGRGGEVEGRIRNRDGEYRRFLFRTNPLFDDGKLIKWFGVNLDIEDRKQAEEAVRESELNLRQLTETIPQMLWSTKPDGRVDYSNTRLQEFMGITAEDFADHGWADCLHPDDREPTARLWAHCVATGTPYRTEARFCYGGKGNYRWCLTTGLPLRDETGRVIRWHGACVDLHDWKTAQDELRETQAELAHMTRVTTMGQLTASIAHELNQPLAGIMTNASTGMRMLNADPPNVAGARETARRTLRDAGRASEVINRLRALFTKKSTTFEAVDLNLAIQEVIALTSTELHRNGVSLRTELTEDLPPVAGDRIQLQQVILNFIMNGTEAMNSVEDRAREMVISTQQDETGYIRLSVKDTGVGFDASSTEKLFSPFFTTKSSGMGIGLSVSRSIIESHQGRLWAEANPGSGATFSFALPSQPGQELADGGHRRHVETSIAAGMIGNA
jgi:PAS domain S-box-containing protein